MFDLDEPKTLPEQVRELLLVLSVQPIVCGIVNVIGLRLAALHQGSFWGTVILCAAFTTTGAFLGMNLAAAGGCVLVLRGEQAPEMRPLARWSLPLTAAVSLLLPAMFFFGGWRGNAATAAVSLLAMLLATLFPLKSPPQDKK